MTITHFDKLSEANASFEFCFQKIEFVKRFVKAKFYKKQIILEQYDVFV